ncbi:MAG: ABC transporter substrate-binding protein [Treponema sp.]|jgi:peptide/nickel transport system substrate-binding protein|nr:ABC transporter substrate-binding protein [Treponema sp.]
MVHRFGRFYRFRYSCRPLPLVLGLALTFRVFALGRGERTQEPAPKVLHVAVMQESPSLDLHKNSTLIARQIGAGQVWEKLVTLNSQSEVVPELAESFEITPDGKTLSFHLRKGVPFHDGSIMSAADVVASMNRWIDSYAPARELAGDSRFEEISGDLVRIRFSSPAVTFPDMMAGSPQSAVITSAAACADEDSRGFMRSCIGTGPFRFSEWQEGRYLRLEKFAAYLPYGTPGEPVDGWAGYKNPRVDEIYYHVVPQAATRVAGLLTGQFDVDYNVDNDDLPAIGGRSDIMSAAYQAGSLTLIFNKKQGPCADLNFRQALNAALDAEEIMQAVFGEQYALGSSYMEDTQIYWNSSAGEDRYNRADPDLARELLKKSAYSGQTIRILTSVPGTTDRGVLALMSQLERIGVKARMEVVDWTTLLQYRNDPSRYDIYTSSFYSVPVPSLKLFFSPSFPGWSDDPHLARLLSGFNSAQNREEAREYWDALQGYSWEYLPVVNLGHFSQTHAWRDRVEGLTVFNGLYFWNAAIR